MVRNKEWIENIILILFFSSFQETIFLILKGDALGILLRYCWLDEDDNPHSFSLLMELISVLTLDNEKSNLKTAELLKQFLDEHGLDKFPRKISLAADHAIAGTMSRHLKTVGLEDLSDALLSVCNSHTHQNILKRLLNEILKMCNNNFCEGISFYMIYIILNLFKILNQIILRMVFANGFSRNFQAQFPNVSKTVGTTKLKS